MALTVEIYLGGTRLSQPQEQVLLRIDRLSINTKNRSFFGI
jgi:hypothetical protein